MKDLTDEQLKVMSREDLETELCTRVYEAALLIEKLEGVGRTFGNGHHAAQKIAAFAVDELQQRWRE